MEREQFLFNWSTKIGNDFIDSGRTYIEPEKEIDVNYYVPKNLVAYVDGGYSKSKKQSSSGVYMPGIYIDRNNEVALSKFGFYSIIKPDLTELRNVTGEVIASMSAIVFAIQEGAESLDIFYDYLGIEMWATGKWKRNKAFTQMYYKFIEDSKHLIEIRFHKVKGHSGVEGNEIADGLATRGLNI